jgi:hypothetical protein
MPFLDHFRSRLILIGRTAMWAIIAVAVLIGLLHNAPAWAETNAECPPNSTTPGQSIPVTPKILYLIYNGPAQTYDVSLCKDPQKPVNVTVKIISKNSNNKIIFAPKKFTLTDTDPQVVTVGVDPKHKATDPFVVILSQSATSEDPEWNYGDLNVPTVTAYYSPPAALKDTYVVQGAQQSFKLPVLDNDVDRLGDGLDVGAIPIPPSRGTASINGDNTIKYTTSSKKAGSDIFYYRVDDAIGNFDVGKIHVIQVPPGAQNPKLIDSDVEDGAQVLYPTSGGDAEVDIPGLVGVPQNADVDCVVANAVSTEAELDNVPLSPGVYTGLVFILNCYVDGKVVTQDQLTGPVVVSIPLTPAFLALYRSQKLSALNWDGDAWHVDGVNVSSSVGAAVLIVETTRFGEFAIFGQNQVRFPFLRRN